MSPRPVLVVLAALALLAPAGCRVKTTPSASAPWVPPAPTDYRQYGLIELQELVRGKMGADTVTMKADGPNHYAGTVKVADGSVLSLTVTVEAERIVADASSPAGSMREVITPKGSSTSLDIK
jgi:hypothetical protein